MRQVVCNYCGKVVEENETVHSINLRFGYGSEHDGESVNLDFHDECMDKILPNIIKDCVVKPYLIGE